MFSGYLRLGAMARDKGNFYEASDWFKEALQINQVGDVNSVLSNNFYFLTPFPFSGYHVSSNLISVVFDVLGFFHFLVKGTKEYSRLHY